MMATMFVALRAHSNTGVVEEHNHIGYMKPGRCAEVWEWSTVKMSFLMILLLSSAGMAQRYTNYNPGPRGSTPGKDPVITAMVWTYHFAYDNQGGFE